MGAGNAGLVHLLGGVAYPRHISAAANRIRYHRN